MCDLEEVHHHPLRVDAVIDISTDKVHRVPPGETHRMGAPSDADAMRLCLLECRHPGEGWRTLEWPATGQALVLPEATEVRLVGRSRRKAREWDRLRA